jgi:hypothetical protein
MVIHGTFFSNKRGVVESHHRTYWRASASAIKRLFRIRPRGHRRRVLSGIGHERKKPCFDEWWVYVSGRSLTGSWRSWAL